MKKKIAIVVATLAVLGGIFAPTANAENELQRCNERCRTEFKNKPEARRLCLAFCQEKWNNPQPLPVQPKDTDTPVK
jgi:hypothetical protein